MTRETLSHLNTNTLIGFTEDRGTAWHYRALEQGPETNHYPGAIPVGDVVRRLFDWQAVPRRVAVEFPADLETMTHLDPDGRPMLWDVQKDRVAVARDDRRQVMGLFMEGYEPHQYREWLLDATSTLLGDSLAISSAGLLRKGAVAWVEVSVPESVHLTKYGVKFRPNLLAGSSFDGSISTFLKRTVTHTRCDNTFELARGEVGQVYRIRHTLNSRLKLSKARRALNIVERLADDFSAEVAALCETDVSERQWRDFVNAHTPLTRDGKKLTGKSLTLASRKRAQLERLWTQDERVSPWKGTAFGVLQAVSTWSHHEKIVRGATRAERNALNAVTGAHAKTDNDTLRQLGTILAG